ncbi:MAG: hypothetical protein ACI808_000619 [Paraglaciecola sp.]
MKYSELKRQLGAFQFYIMSVFLLILAIYVGFNWGNTSDDEQQSELARLNQTLSNLQIENNELTKTLNIHGVELEVARLSEQQIHQEIKQGLQREQELRSDLAFYQQIMAPELSPKGFAIESFNIEAALSEREFRFELVLMQQEKIKKTLKGNIKVSLLGSENGKSKRISLASLMPDKGESLKFNFKYFQVIDGQLRLPKNFEPEKILVHADIYQFKVKRGTLDKSFDWLLSPDFSSE